MRATSIAAVAVAMAAGCATAPVSDAPTPTEAPVERGAPVLRLVDLTPRDGSRVDSSTVIVARVAYDIPGFDPDATYTISAVFAGPDGRLFNRGGGVVQVRSPAGIATVRHSLERLLAAGDEPPITPLTGTFFLLEAGPLPPPPDASRVDTERTVRTAVVTSPVRARTRTFFFNGAGPARSFATALPDALEQYWTYRPHKALAMAYDGSGRWAAGYSYGFASVEEAAERALEYCRISAERREIDLPCRVIALDDEPVDP